MSDFDSHNEKKSNTWSVCNKKYYQGFDHTFAVKHNQITINQYFQLTECAYMWNFITLSTC